MTQRTIDAVFFDVGATLLRPYPSVPEVCQDVLACAGYRHDLDEIDRLMPLADRFYEDRYRADDSFWADDERACEVWVGMYTLVCRELGHTDDAPMLAREVYDQFARADRWRPYDDVLPAFERLRAQGIRLGVISNWDLRLRKLLGDLGLAPYLDEIVCSAEVSMRKPDPRMFARACEALDVVPERAAHVGDHGYADYLGARSAGLGAVLIDRAGGEPPLAGPMPIGSFDELDEALGI